MAIIGGNQPKSKIIKKGGCFNGSDIVNCFYNQLRRNKMVDAKTIRKLISAYYALRIELVKADGNPLDALDAADEAVSELEIKIDNYEYAKLRGGKI